MAINHDLPLTLFSMAVVPNSWAEAHLLALGSVILARGPVTNFRFYLSTAKSLQIM